MNMFDLFVYFNWRELNIHVGIFLFLIIMAIIILLKVFSYRSILNRWDAVEANISLGNIGSVKIKPNHIVSQIAHEVWVELQTRKAALPFDQEDDLIVEVYDSWYQLFKEIRQLLRKIPADKIKNNKDAKKLTNILTQSLNQGLRPHLTKYQAKFRKWYLSEINKDSNGLTPQEIQRNYKYYNDLINDIKETNVQLIEYTKFIQELAHGK